MKKGDTFTVKHSDGKLVTETVAKIETERFKEKVNRYHHITNNIIETYYQVTRTTYVICESAAVYDIKEI
jgi:hypothetical protein